MLRAPLLLALAPEPACGARDGDRAGLTPPTPCLPTVRASTKQRNTHEGHTGAVPRCIKKPCRMLLKGPYRFHCRGPFKRRVPATPQIAGTPATRPQRLIPRGRLEGAMSLT